MTCDELADQLADYVAGRLMVEALEVFRGHLTRCPDCMLVVEQYEVMIRITRALPKCEPLPPALEARLRTAVGLDAR
jgi:anti-sigma factor RsiW